MDLNLMQRAYEIAKNGIGFTSPNPCVGALIEKGGIVVAESWHKVAGGPHAEVNAINELMKKSFVRSMEIDKTLFQNATLYVTLEPCCFHGKTPACTDLLLKAGFKKICIGTKDPNKKVNGKGIGILKKHGIEVEILEDKNLIEKLTELNQPFFKFVKCGMPYVILKAGISLDGKIATAKGESKWITSEISRNDAKNIRSKCDAVIVGGGTVKKDNPELGATEKYKNKKLLRVIIDQNLSVSLDAKVFRDENVFVACTDLASKKRKEEFKKNGIKFKSFGKKEISIKKLLLYLGAHGILSVFVEGGSIVFGKLYDSFLKEKNVLDKIIFYIAPKIIGGKNALPVIGGDGIDKLKNIHTLKNFISEKSGDDIKISGVFNVY
ncbi:bifunctional diaminohydroxyphosphoribosylaminopyrimidine deaminase/5-amino-6-(5-phosphoribosylamino)uracil reductase RibD [Candidatus Gracilibacteria bacterium]|jgi:diaminohydroxyphosphoribosylaminopyrimidine deaminase/5-amino-6-(5-phosphoribosylamino)uracil reductase|nr:bifunctional diaminohydroxyphosphoribosylaminopyrimidine deaminase/5-amino-6-(5-phosphoribosylamino)uracil reductase RibD [Candidatus Gracilibacteria bacterium]